MRLLAVRDLVRAGPAEVKDIVAGLRHDDVQVRYVAATALGILADESAVDALQTAALHDPDALARSPAIVALGQIGDQASVDPLRRIEAEDRSKDVRHQAALAIDLQRGGHEPLSSFAGEAFAQAIQGDPLRGPAEEINQAADEAIARFSFIDGERQCAGGASYGGHLANWLQGSTDRYRCLISHAGLVNLESQWGTSDIAFSREANLGGPPWELAEVWQEQNPVRFAANWRTPTLVTIGKLDYRVPLNNALEYWTALQRQRVESRLLVYPNENHWIQNGHNSRLFYGEIAAWLERWLLEAEE